MTIIEAIKEVMRAKGQPMTAREAYDAIVERKLYEFHAQNPAHVVQMQIRRHSEGIDFATAGATKHFRLVGENKFAPLDQPKRAPKRTAVKQSVQIVTSPRGRTLGSSLQKLQELHAQYLQQLKHRITAELRQLSPAAFETFGKGLLDVYGFEDTQVTQVSKDGGIDGHGKLKVGLAHLNVAFQCKRWRNGSIQRPEIDKFRGAIQGDFEQGIFFATTSFSTGAVGASIKRGAVPVVLLDANSIVELMLTKQFGIEVQNLVVPTYALDLAFTPDSERATASHALSPLKPLRSGRSK